MERTDAVIIGGGQAGLAMSRCLTERRIPHVVLERGQVGERWRSERWDSSRLLTANWHSRLPHWHYRGDDPDGYMTMPEMIRYLEDYAASFEAPIRTGVNVEVVERADAEHFRVRSHRGTWITRNVVIATGFCDLPRIPGFAAGLATDVGQVTPKSYKNPDTLPPGNVLVVGASATGTQIAAELAAAGRKVTLAVGTHTRLPRTYRGKDILWWIDMMGGFLAPARPEDERQAPPPQLVGSEDRGTLDLGVLQANGVRLVGRAVAAKGHRMRFADDLGQSVAAADARLQRLVERIDEFVGVMGLEHRCGAPEPMRPVRPDAAPTSIDLAEEGITNVLWATGFRRAYPWLKLPVLDERGEIRQRGGLTSEAGLYVLGMRFQRRKNSNTIDGVGIDAEELSRHLAGRLPELAVAG